LENRNESSCFGKKDVQELQDHQTQRRGPGDLQRSAAQATPGLTGRLLPDTTAAGLKQQSHRVTIRRLTVELFRPDLRRT
jgi:hypothetical protein